MKLTLQFILTNYYIKTIDGPVNIIILLLFLPIIMGKINRTNICYYTVNIRTPELLMKLVKLFRLKLYICAVNPKINKTKCVYLNYKIYVIS